jgi:hypothetical protein
MGDRALDINAASTTRRPEVHEINKAGGWEVGDQRSVREYEFR